MTGTPLSELTTLGVGGPASELIQVSTREELVAAFRDVCAEHDEWRVLGGGSNIVVADAGVNAPVIRIRTRGIDAMDSPQPGKVRVRAEAGEGWDDLVAWAVSKGFAGLESLSGIPGTVGAAPIQNIGAYGAELADTLVSIEWLDENTGEIETLSATDLQLGYRSSILKHGMRRGIVVSVLLELSTDIPAAELAATRAEVLKVRASKGMVLSDDPDSRSAGSFFMNPIVRETFARDLPADAPRYPAGRTESGESLVKLSAAWLIDNAGIRKGFALPGSNAAVSSKHTLAITNRGGATSAQVWELARFIELRVQQTFGINLVPEPSYWN